MSLRRGLFRVSQTAATGSEELPAQLVEIQHFEGNSLGQKRGSIRGFEKETRSPRQKASSFS